MTKFHEISIVHDPSFCSPIILKIWKGTAVVLPCSVQNFKMIGSLEIKYGQTRIREIWVGRGFWVQLAC